MRIFLSCSVILMLFSGCFYRSTKVEFPPAKKVSSISVEADGPGALIGNEIVIEDPGKVERLLELLKRYQGTWETEKPRRDVGPYRVAVSGPGIILIMRVGNGLLEYQGGDFKKHYKEISSEEERTLFSLLSIPRD